MSIKSKLSLSKTIDQYRDEIYKRNCRNFVSLSKGGAIIAGVITVFGALMSAYTEFLVEYGMFFAYMLIMYAVSYCCEKYHVKHIVLIYYIALTPIFLGGIAMGTFLDPDEPAITIMILICVMTLFVIDYPLSGSIYIICVAIAFTVCCYFSKSKELFIADMIDLAIYSCIALGLRYFLLKGQVESAQNFCLVQYKSERDALTRIYNRGTGEQKVKEYLEACESGSLFILDIDLFKSVNDMYGHKVGDEVICEVADILTRVFRPEDIVFRLGGDEFAIFAKNLTNRELCKKRCEEIRTAANHIKTSNPMCTSVNVSIGCTTCHGEMTDFETIYRMSDEFLYKAKNTGKGNDVFND